jgi:glycosyltransferase A (GT-A) superfamily protein (DUF2064 family)
LSHADSYQVHGIGPHPPRHVLVMVKAPVPGRVKTRLCPPCTPHEAAAIAEAALADTLDAVAACGAERKVIALDGVPGPWLPPGFEVIGQRGDAFDERLACAWADTGGCGIQIGMDTPQVTAELLDAQLTALVDTSRRYGPMRRRRVALLGPALDGGWWMIGLPGCDPRAVFIGVPTSTPFTGAAQADRLASLGFDVMTAPELVDIDHADDLRQVTAAIPCSRTAAAASRVLARVDGTFLVEVGA